VPSNSEAVGQDGEVAERDGDRVWAGSVPAVYEQLIVPLIMEPYARELAQRAAALHPQRVLELGTGTGVVTRAALDVLPLTTEYVATDLNQDMLNQAMHVGTSRPVRFQHADAMALPFDDASFDLVLCQFSVMFFPDKPAAYRETHRVLTSGGRFVFDVWGSLDTNDVPNAVTDAIVAMFPQQPPLYLRRTPYAYFDEATIRRDLADGGFTDVEIEVIDARSHAPTAYDAAKAFVEGTPLRDEIEARAPGQVEAATEAAAAEVARRLGDTDIDGRISALVVTATKQ
jgi:ubiquinone/menaquinone biosynthesis C-methylase UbiE